MGAEASRESRRDAAEPSPGVFPIDEVGSSRPYGGLDFPQCVGMPRRRPERVLVSRGNCLIRRRGHSSPVVRPRIVRALGCHRGNDEIRAGSGKPCRASGSTFATDVKSRRPRRSLGARGALSCEVVERVARRGEPRGCGSGIVNSYPWCPPIHTPDFMTGILKQVVLSVCLVPLSAVPGEMSDNIRRL